MKVFILILIFSFSLLGRDIFYNPVIFTLYGGVSKYNEKDDADNVDLGFHVGSSMLGKFSKNVALGCDLAYNRWSVDTGSDKLEIDLSAYEVLGAIRLSTTPRNRISAFFQFGAGMYIKVVDSSIEIWGQKESNSEDYEDFGVSFSGGVNIDKFIVSAGYKISSNSNDHSNEPYDEASKWFNFSIGFNL